MYNRKMKNVKVIWKDADSVVSEREVDDLSSAMNLAKELNCLVTIKCGEMEIIGLFGADSIVDGKCPDGVDYTWMKRRSQ